MVGLLSSDDIPVLPKPQGVLFKGEDQRIKKSILRVTQDGFKPPEGSRVLSRKGSSATTSIRSIRVVEAEATIVQSFDPVNLHT